MGNVCNRHGNFTLISPFRLTFKQASNLNMCETCINAWFDLHANVKIHDKRSGIPICRRSG